MLISIDQILEWRPCDKYDTEDKIIKQTDPNWPKDPLEIANLKIPIPDILWVLLRPEIIPEEKLHLLACDFAEHVLHIFEERYPDNHRPRKAIEAKRSWIKGEITLEELVQARAAAYDASYNAAAYAARAATRAAYTYAAREAAYDAADDADDAADAAAERKWQLNQVIETLKHIGEYKCN